MARNNLIGRVQVAANFSKINSANVAIANSASVSSAAFVANSAIIAIEMPAVWTAANLCFKTSFDGTNYKYLYANTTTQVLKQLVVTQDKYIMVDPGFFNITGFSSPMPFNYIKFKSCGASNNNVNQGAARSIRVVYST